MRSVGSKEGNVAAFGVFHFEVVDGLGRQRQQRGCGDETEENSFHGLMLFLACFRCKGKDKNADVQRFLVKVSVKRSEIGQNYLSLHCNIGE